MPRLFIHAINVHHGGGAVLLGDLLRVIPPHVEAVVSVDARMELPANLPDWIHVERTIPTLLSRLSAEWRLFRAVEANDQVLCFGNLPPLFKLRGDTTVFLHNRYLVDLNAPLHLQPIKLRIRLWLERIWLLRCQFNASRYFVQTPSMQKLSSCLLHVPVTCKPFVPESSLDQVSASSEVEFDFLYVASGEPHKNHAALIDAWGLLANEGLFPSLALTLEPKNSPKLCLRIKREVASRGLRIQNLGILPHDRLLMLYSTSGALIYPSYFESFGLPLIEANQAGLPILAPELDYVRDIIDPDEAFDPASPVSIARAVKRFRKGGSPTFVLNSAEQFLADVMGRD